MCESANEPWTNDIIKHLTWFPCLVFNMKNIETLNARYKVVNKAGQTVNVKQRIYFYFYDHEFTDTRTEHQNKVKVNIVDMEWEIITKLHAEIETRAIDIIMKHVYYQYSL